MIDRWLGVVGGLAYLQAMRPHGKPQDTTQRAAVDLLAALLDEHRAVVVTGAGCSTESGIPDYRGPGAVRRHAPIQYREFVTDAVRRARYWARATVGWSRVSSAQPNPAHRALAALERIGRVTGVITQNVDGLHHRAGSRNVLDLHGLLSRVRCLDCGAIEPRAGLQERLLAANPDYAWRTATSAPDGDADLEPAALDGFIVPGCRVCDGVLKPDVVFFGENVPRGRVDRAWSLYEQGQVLLVVGSSLSVFSGFRFVHRAAKDGKPVVILNVGWTRGDEHARLKIEGRVGEVLPRLVDRVRDGRHAVGGYDRSGLRS